MRVRQDFLIGTLSSLFATTLVAAISFVSGFLRGISAGESVRFVVVGLYFLLFVIAVFVFAAGRPSRIDPLQRLPRFGRWPKMILAVCVLAGALPLIWIFIPYSAPPLRIHIENHARYSVLISDQAIFHITLPETPASDSIVERGFCQLSWLTNPVQRDKPLLVFSNGSADLKCQMLNPTVYRRFIESENMNIELFLTNDQGYEVSAKMALNKHTLENHWLVFEFKDEQRSF